MNINTHQCSYYCTGTVHAIEAFISDDVPDADIQAHFNDPRNTLIGATYLSHRRLNEVDAAFMARAMQGRSHEGYQNYKPVLVFICTEDHGDEREEP